MKKQSPFFVHIPAKLVRKNGRKRIFLPDRESLPQLSPEQNEHLIHALLCAHKWQKLIGTDKIGSSEQLAKKVGVSPGYVSRILRLNQLAPDIYDWGSSKSQMTFNAWVCGNGVVPLVAAYVFCTLVAEAIEKTGEP